MPYCWILLSVVLGLVVGLLIALLYARKAIGRARRAEQLAQRGQTDLSALIGSLAHELKNPLSTITVNLKLLAEDFQQAADDRERHTLVRLDVLRQETRRLSSLLDDVLQYVRRPELHPSSFDINKLLADMIEFYSPQAQSARLTLRHQFYPGPLVCSIDTDLLKQALLNIMINAQQAMPDGGELIIRTSLNASLAVIDIADTGPGISESDKQKMFKISFSTKLGGSGLGLPITKRIIEAHRGSIEVHSTPGRGTSFRISLPLAS
ncbi:MAG: two-component sensor histidine kinase [Actinobacteria bacterium]|nr:two-component sensor histidine kinase [Actinomycetota bacterium]